MGRGRAGEWACSDQSTSLVWEIRIQRLSGEDAKKRKNMGSFHHFCKLLVALCTSVNCKMQCITFGNISFHYFLHNFLMHETCISGSKVLCQNKIAMVRWSLVLHAIMLGTLTRLLQHPLDNSQRKESAALENNVGQVFQLFRLTESLFQFTRYEKKVPRHKTTILNPQPQPEGGSYYKIFLRSIQSLQYASVEHDSAISLLLKNFDFICEIWFPK